MSIRKVKNQFDIAAEAFEKLRHIVETTPCSIEAEMAVADLEVELIELGLDIQ
jgi:hypothetical protein